MVWSEGRAPKERKREKTARALGKGLFAHREAGNSPRLHTAPPWRCRAGRGLGRPPGMTLPPAGASGKGRRLGAGQAEGAARKLS